MVWHAESTPAGVEATLQQDLWRDLAQVPVSSFHDPQRLPEVIRGVASFMRDQSTSRAVAATEWRCWLARALWAAGECETAEALLSQHAHRKSMRLTLRALCACPRVAPVCWQAALRGLLRFRAECATAAATPFWVLDLSGGLKNEDVLELAQMRTARQWLHALAPVWDETRGQGTLGLFLPRAGTGRVEHLAQREWMDWLHRGLLDEQQRRNWVQTPGIQRLR